MLFAYLTHHGWLLDRDGTSVSHIDTGMEGGVVPVSSMSACDTAAYLDSENAVHFGAHPTLARIVHLLAGVDDGGRNDRNSNRLYLARKRMCDKRLQKPNLQVIVADISAQGEKQSKNTSFLLDQRADVISSENQQHSAVGYG